MKILFLHTEKSYTTNAATHAIIDALKEEFGITKALTTIADDYSPYKVMNTHWGKGDDIITIEQDAIFTREQLRALIDCPHPNCTFFSKASKHYQEKSHTLEMSNMGYWERNGTLSLYPMTKARAMIGGFTEMTYAGFTKWGKDMQGNPLREVSIKWIGVDVMLLWSARSKGDRPRFHVHGEVGHDHVVSASEEQG